MILILGGEPDSVNGIFKNCENESKPPKIFYKLRGTFNKHKTGIMIIPNNM